MIQVTLKGDKRQFEEGVTAAEVAKSIGAGLYKAACAAKVDGEACDLRTPLEKDCTLEIMTFDSPEGQHAFWHTAAHVMAQAVQHLFPRARFGIGPALDDGWYYDIKADRPLTTGDFDAIEAEMKKIIKADLPVEKRFITAEEGRALFAGQDYKLELLEEYMPLYGSLEESYLAIYNSMPITLENINTVSSERIEVVDEALKDRWNNIYDGGVRFQINYDDSYALYNLGGQFTAFEGTVFVGMDDTAENISFSIYLDEELVFHRDGITVETEPISIALDVTGKQTMRITMSGERGITWASTLTFGNTSFTRAEESESSQPSAEGQAEQSQPPAESQA